MIEFKHIPIGGLFLLSNKLYIRDSFDKATEHNTGFTRTIHQKAIVSTVGTEAYLKLGLKKPTLARVY